MILPTTLVDAPNIGWFAPNTFAFPVVPVYAQRVTWTCDCVCEFEFLAPSYFCATASAHQVAQYEFVVLYVDIWHAKGCRSAFRGELFLVGKLCSLCAKVARKVCHSFTGCPRAAIAHGILLHSKSKKKSVSCYAEIAAASKRRRHTKKKP